MAYDNLDNQLINALLDDSRASFRSLGEELNVSMTAVSDHINDLEAAGVIEGYTPIIGYGEVGYDVTAIMQLKIERAALTEIVDRLRDQEQIISVYEIIGDYDIIAIGKFEDTNRMNAQIKELLADINIRESNTSVVLNTIKENDLFELDVAKE